MNSAKQNAGTRKVASHGYTLIELMVVVAIIGILAIIAYPSYTHYVTRANRSAAESFIMSVANKQEQYLLDARQYAGVAADPGDATGLATLGMTPPPEVSRNYDIMIGRVALNPPDYKVTAVPRGNQATADADCGSVSITHAGAKSPADCW